MSWQASVDRVLEMRRAALVEREKAELVRIIQELEKRCQVVVNREVSAVLKGVPSWKTPAEGAASAEKKRSFRVGTRTWADKKRVLEKQARAGTDKLRRRTQEFEQVLNGTFGTEAAVDSGSQSSETSKENSDAAGNCGTA